MNLPWRTESALVIRTDFVHAAEWDAIQRAILEPQLEEGFMPSVELVDDREYDGLTVPQLLELAPANIGFVAFLVDTQTLTHPERPILVIDLWQRDGRTFRVIPSEMWSVENNLSQANMDWKDFAEQVDPDGIYRGLDY